LTRPRFFGPLSILIIALLSAGCEPPAAPVAETIRPVQTMVITPDEDVRWRSFPGTVESSRRVELAFRVPGLLETLAVKEGQQVAEGDLIAQLRQGEFVARVETLQGELDQARAALRALRAGERPEEIRRREAVVRSARVRLANARADYGRKQSLLARNATSRNEFDQAQTAYLVAQEEYTEAKESLDQASIGREEDIEAMEARIRGLEGRLVESQIQLQDATLLAPYDGVIAERFVDQGQTIVANDRVVQFKDIEEIDIAMDVPETVMASEVLRADVIHMTAELSAAPGVRFPVRVREVSQVADRVTQTFNVRVAMEAPPDIRVLPGMTASVMVEYRRPSILGKRTLVPVEAVMQTADGKQVAWVINEDNTVTSRPITLGAATAGSVEVTEGLVVGDRIIVAGVRFLRDGMLVRDLGDALGDRS
jgi:RND family efflux transporter MFP subunit